MINLWTSNPDVLELISSSAADLEVIVHYVDTAVDIPKSLATKITTATTTTILSYPASESRLVKSITINNKHASTNNTVNVQLDSGAVNYIIVTATLQPYDTLVYEDGMGWAIISSSGERTTLALNSGSITGLTEDTAPLLADYTVTADVSDSNNPKKVLLQNLFARGILSKTANYTVTTDDWGKTIRCDASGGSFTITLPAVATATNGFPIRIIKVDSSANLVTIDPNGSEKIDELTTVVLSSQYSGIAIVAWDTTTDVWSCVDQFDPGMYAQVCGGRLTIDSTNKYAVPTTDQTGKTIVYFVPHNGNRIALYNTISLKWDLLPIPPVASVLSLTTTGTLASGAAASASKVYDIFAYNNGGVVALYGLVWTNATTRATALAIQDGVYVLSGSASYRYLGSVYTNSSTQLTDSAAARLVWNYNNRVPYRDFRNDDANSWNDNGNGTFSTINSGGAVWKHEFLRGVSEDPVYCEAHLHHAAKYVYALGLDWSSGTPDRAGGSTAHTAATNTSSMATYTGMPSAGYHYVQGVETSYDAGGPYNAFGDNSASFYINSGLLSGGRR